jgi:hypothetical protein
LNRPFARDRCQQIFHFGRFPFQREKELRVETPEARKVKSTIVVDLKGGYLSTDR